jgi:hypothetical protein
MHIKNGIVALGVTARTQPDNDILPFPRFLIPGNPNNYTRLGVGFPAMFVIPTKIDKLPEPIFRCRIFAKSQNL